MILALLGVLLVASATRYGYTIGHKLRAGLTLFVVTIDDHSNPRGEQMVSLHLTKVGAEDKIKSEATKRWQRVDSEAEKFFVQWKISERTIEQ